MKYENFDIDTIQEEIRGPEDLIEFIRMLKETVVPTDPDFTTKRLRDVLEALAAWIEDTNPPDQPNWGYVARLMVAAVYYN